MSFSDYLAEHSANVENDRINNYYSSYSCNSNSKKTEVPMAFLDILMVWYLLSSSVFSAFNLNWQTAAVELSILILLFIVAEWGNPYNDWRKYILSGFRLVVLILAIINNIHLFIK